MPEPKSHNAHFVVLGAMGLMVVILLFLFRRIRWL
jgi:LPXTG-motif cell wall-anchored protein